MIDIKELAEYISKRMKRCTVKGVDGEWLYIKKPSTAELGFWIQQYLVKDSCGHSEWSERYKRNIWIKDVDNISETEER